MKFTVNIEETINQEFEVEAKNYAEALELAEMKYKSSEFVLDQPSLSARQMAIVRPDGEVIEWVEF